MFYVQVRHGNSMPLNMSSSLDVFRCLLVTNKADRPVLDCFELNDFAIIIGVPERTTFVQTLFLIFRLKYSASSYDMSG